MRNAPSVTYPVGRCAFFGWMLVLIGVLAALALALWWWLFPARPTSWTLGGAIAWLSWSALAWWYWRHQPIGQLQWDAEATRFPSEQRGIWRWSLNQAPPRELQEVAWVLDAQTVALLRLHAEGQRPQWLWLQARDDPVRWVELRRALAAYV